MTFFLTRLDRINIDRRMALLILLLIIFAVYAQALSFEFGLKWNFKAS